jgi:CrcB protein
MNMILAVAAGGALGSVARYLVGLQAARWLGVSFPWGTLAVNLAGSFAIGVIAEAVLRGWAIAPEWRAFLTVGILGGFTTFSAFSLDVANLIERGALGAAAVYVAASVVGSIAGLFAGLWLVRSLV